MHDICDFNYSSWNKKCFPSNLLQQLRSTYRSHFRYPTDYQSLSITQHFQVYRTHYFQYPIVAYQEFTIYLFQTQKTKGVMFVVSFITNAHDVLFNRDDCDLQLLWTEAISHRVKCGDWPTTILSAVTVSTQTRESQRCPLAVVLYDFFNFFLGNLCKLSYVPYLLN